MDNVTSFAQRLRILWLAICSGGAAILAVMGWMVVSGNVEPTFSESSETGFYLVAVLSMGALGLALFLIRTMETRLLHTSSEADAMSTIQTLGIASLAIVDASTVGAAVAALLTGDLLVLAFGLPLFAFAALTWPSDGRVAHWLQMGRGER